ncbi:MAG TPA: YggS family pyridoxal phosphate-dependent enzyme [Thermoanaerobaculia bacterium]|nr:YggS family pyridoxal phosphate-dependent enzyme [Thermoanaerobaculia bacterium]
MDPESIRANLAAIESRISAACSRAGRPRESVTLVAVSKTFPAAAVEAAVAAGATDVGENRVQEMREKVAVVVAKPRWHLIGHLQSNKAKDAVRIADVIHSIDSIGLADKVARAAAAQGKTQEILLEVNIGREEQKSGIMPEDAELVTAEVAKLPALALRGLMAIPPAGTPEETRRWFVALRELRDRLRPKMAAGFEHLSMGMSEDFEVAIEEGATMIRVGRAIFGPRG